MKRLARFLFLAYYWTRIRVLRKCGVRDALAVTLESAVFPMLVLKLGEAKIGRNVRVLRGLLAHNCGRSFENLSIGDDVFLGNRTIIDLTDRVTIGSRVAIGMDVRIITHSDYGESAMGKICPRETAPVVIEDDTVVNWGCTVLKGTVVSSRCIVAPNSVVQGVLQSGRVYCGNPARPLPQVARVSPHL